MFAATVPPNVGRAAFITVANVAARRHVRHVPSHVRGYVLIMCVQFLVDQ